MNLQTAQITELEAAVRETGAGRTTSNGTPSRVPSVDALGRVAEMEKKMRQLAELVREKDAQVTAVAQQGDMLRSERDRAVSQVQVLQEDLARAQSSLMALEREQEALRAPAVGDVGSELVRLQVENTELQDVIRDLERKIQRQQVAASEYKKESAELKKAMEEKEKNVDGLKKIIDQQEELVTEQNKVQIGLQEKVLQNGSDALLAF